MRTHRLASFQARDSRSTVHILATLHSHRIDTHLVVLTGPIPLAASPLLAGLAVIGCAAFAPPASAAASHCFVLPALAVSGWVISFESRVEKTKCLSATDKEQQGEIEMMTTSIVWRPIKFRQRQETGNIDLI
jgi:hypothetical protein